MASLKEVKNRISSVNSTRKITSAMKMVASSKLHHAQQAIEQMLPYEQKLHGIMSSFVASLEGELSSPYAVRRDVKHVAIIAFSSNSSLCGGFNVNVIKQLKRSLEDYASRGIEVTHIYPIGRKVTEAAKKLGFIAEQDYSHVLDHPQYAPVSELAAQIMELFAQEEIDQVDLQYYHFKSAGSQILRSETYLPIELGEQTEDETATNYLVEPSPQALLNELIPRSLHLKLYSALLDSLASEHAARVIAMQVATDNADELLSQLTLQYNKTRQQAITAELLDIAGGSMQ